MGKIDSRRRFSCTCHVLLVPWVCLAGAANASVLYVDDSAVGANNGSSWCSAFVHLQDALAAAGGSIHEIRVAQGIYYPDRGYGRTPGDRTATFSLINGVRIAGGYAGCGSDEPNDRDFTLYRSVLSGDLVGNDTGSVFDPSRSENAFHVVTGSGTRSTAVLEGFTITGGRADATNKQNSPDNYGGGLFCHGGNPRVVDCTFTGNWAYTGGGAFYLGGEATARLERCVWVENAGRVGGGLAVKNARVTLIDCTLTGNTAGWEGGGAHFSYGAFSTLERCTFVGNHAVRPDDTGNPSRGGAVYGLGSHFTVTDSRFLRNSAEQGGGFFGRGAQGSVHRCRFDGNTARLDGGGVSQESGIDHSSCSFRGNTAGRGGALSVQLTGFYTDLENVEFYLNHASDPGGGGGAIYQSGADTPAMFVHNCTLHRNSATAGGGVFVLPGSTRISIWRSILWQNSDAEGTGLAAQVTGDSTIVWSAVQGWIGSNFSHAEDPRFTPGPGGCHYLSQVASGQLADSPCVDRGDGPASSLPFGGLTTRTDQGADLGILDQGSHYPMNLGRCTPGRFECEGRADLWEIARLQNCFGGRPTDEPHSCCELSDVNSDGMVNLADYGELHLVFR